MIITNAEAADLKPILELQYVAYQSEAKLCNNFSIQPLMETLEEITEEYQNGIMYKALDEQDEIIGSVRRRAEAMCVSMRKT